MGAKEIEVLFFYDTKKKCSRSLHLPVVGIWFTVTALKDEPAKLIKNF